MERTKVTMKKTVLNKAKAIIFGVFAFLIIASSLFHAPLKRFSDEYKEHRKNYKPIISERIQIQDSLANELGKTISIEEYKKLRVIAWNNSKAKLKKYTAKKNELFSNHMFRGRSNLKFWLFLFGVVLLGFYFSVKSLINDINKKVSSGHEYVSASGISVCLFWFYHLFFQTGEDFYVDKYFYLSVCIAFLIGFFVFKLIKYFYKKDSLIEIIRKLFNFIFVEVEKKDFVNKDKKEEFVKRRVELAKHAMDNE